MRKVPEFFNPEQFETITVMVSGAVTESEIQKTVAVFRDIVGFYECMTVDADGYEYSAWILYIPRVIFPKVLLKLDAKFQALGFCFADEVVVKEPCVCPLDAMAVGA